MTLEMTRTIVALSSAQGVGARAIIRLSGPDVISILRPLLVLEEDWGLERKHWEGAIPVPGHSSTLPADVYVQVGPHSYTGQDLVELHVLSCPPLIDLIIAEILNRGARSAEPGEFTLRGFLNGKLDLTRAEAVIGVIEAGSSTELQQALRQLAGGMARPLQSLRDDLLNLLADIEAGLDFSDEDITFVDQEVMLKRLAAAMAQVTLLSKQVDQRDAGDPHFRAVLAGRPNAGKSSLFNALGGYSAALVSQEQGTTRDYLTQSLEMEGMVVELVDTAGWMEEKNTIEAQAQALGREQSQQADLVLLCAEGDKPLTDEENELLRSADPPVVLVSTKCDEPNGREQGIATSAVSKAGLDLLRGQIASFAREKARPAMAPGLSRCRHHIAACLEHLRQAHGSVLYEDPSEIVAMELRGGLDHLGEMAGAVYTDDLLDRIFSRFCIGK